MKKLAIILTLFASPLMAQDVDDARVFEIVRTCFSTSENSVDGKRFCIGRGALACMEGNEGGLSTLGQTDCQYVESQAWDVLLNEEYQSALATAKEVDADDEGVNPEFARRVETLQAMQRAWIPFRDAKCEADYAKWGVGSMRNIAVTGCLMETTAEQTIQIWAMYDDFG